MNEEEEFNLLAFAPDRRERRQLARAGHMCALCHLILDFREILQVVETDANHSRTGRSFYAHPQCLELFNEREKTNV